MEIRNTVTIITGGVSGLGEASARALIQRGGRVALLDMNKERGEQLAKELGKRRHVPASRCDPGKGDG